MRPRWTARTIVGIGAAMLALAAACASDRNSGDWTMHPSQRPGSVQFTLHGSSSEHNFTTSSDWPKSSFSGLDFSRSGAQDVRFAVTRDAGKFDFEGVLRDEAGAGTFRFSPDPRYVQEMKSLGFDGVADHQMQFAVHDVSLSFARDMKNEKLGGLDTDKLMAFRIHGVTVDMARRVRVAGYTPDSDDLIAMRIHGASPEFMEAFGKRGYQKLPLDKFIEFRIHGVSPDMVDELSGLGYDHPSPDQLVAMRIHGVTPQYIGDLQARGLKNLTIEKLVSMKIHGID
jgi:hypothetical protein